jgi:hypothetical protein
MASEKKQKTGKEAEEKFPWFILTTTQQKMIPKSQRQQVVEFLSLEDALRMANANRATGETLYDLLLTYTNLQITSDFNLKKAVHLLKDHKSPRSVRRISSEGHPKIRTEFFQLLFRFPLLESIEVADEELDASATENKQITFHPLPNERLERLKVEEEYLLQRLSREKFFLFHLMFALDNPKRTWPNLVEIVWQNSAVPRSILGLPAKLPKLQTFKMYAPWSRLGVLFQLGENCLGLRELDLFEPLETPAHHDPNVQFYEAFDNQELQHLFGHCLALETVRLASFHHEDYFEWTKNVKGKWSYKCPLHWRMPLEYQFQILDSCFQTRFQTLHLNNFVHTHAQYDTVIQELVQKVTNQEEKKQKVWEMDHLQLSGRTWNEFEEDEPFHSIQEAHSLYQLLKAFPSLDTIELFSFDFGESYILKLDREEKTVAMQINSVSYSDQVIQQWIDLGFRVERFEMKNTSNDRFRDIGELNDSFLLNGQVENQPIQTLGLCCRFAGAANSYEDFEGLVDDLSEKYANHLQSVSLECDQRYAILRRLHSKENQNPSRVSLFKFFRRERFPKLRKLLLGLSGTRQTSNTSLFDEWVSNACFGYGLNKDDLLHLVDLEEISVNLTKFGTLYPNDVINEDILKFSQNNPHLKVCRLNLPKGEEGRLGHENFPFVLPLVHTLEFYVASDILYKDLVTLQKNCPRLRFLTIHINFHYGDEIQRRNDEAKMVQVFPDLPFEWVINPHIWHPSPLSPLEQKYLKESKLGPQAPVLELSEKKQTSASSFKIEEDFQRSLDPKASFSTIEERVDAFYHGLVQGEGEDSVKKGLAETLLKRDTFKIEGLFEKRPGQLTFLFDPKDHRDLFMTRAKELFPNLKMGFRPFLFQPSEPRDQK